MQGQMEPCWLDYIMTKEQLRPGRVLSRADKYLTDVLQSKPEIKKDVDKIYRVIKLNDKAIARVVAGSLRVDNEAAKAFLSTEEQDILNDFSNDFI
eukprot:4987764-Karenia_brevis.AAC.1